VSRKAAMVRLRMDGEVAAPSGKEVSIITRTWKQEVTLLKAILQ
jgi:hypothetical protein